MDFVSYLIGSLTVLVSLVVGFILGMSVSAKSDTKSDGEHA